MSNQYGPRIVTNGLTVCLDASNTKSYPATGTTWADLSNNGYNAILTNGPTYSNNNNGFITFDGSNDHAIISNWNTFTGNAVFSYDLFFMKFNNNNANYVSYGTAGTSQMNQFGVFNNTIGALNYINDTAVSVSQISNNTWTYAAVTHNGFITRLYFNGVLANSRNTSYNFGASSFYIGQAAIGGFYANIRLASFKFYNRVLSDNEILQNYNATKSKYIL